jgi:uncharacterized membrane protein
MERGAKQLVLIVLGAMLFGLAVIALRPEYRAAAAAMWKGRMHESPVWISNKAYYPGIPWKAEAGHED